MIEITKTHGEKFKENGQKFKQEVTERMLQYVLAAFGFVAGLAWNEAVKSLIEYLFPLTQHTLLAKFFYAIIVTFLLVVVSLYLVKLLRGEEQEQ